MPNEFTCGHDGCGVTYSKKSKLIYHMRKHTGERSYKCDEEGCMKTYTNSSHLRRHKSTFHGEKENLKVICAFEGCGLVLANKYSLKKHVNRKHTANNYEFSCEECGQGFHRKRQLHEHFYLHSGEAPYKCDKCSSNFTSFKSFAKHKRNHKNYTCECGLIFHQWTLILTHKRTCSLQAERFICEVCKKKCSNRRNLESHRLIHQSKLDKNVYVCSYANCTRFYFYERNLRVHINTNHKKINVGKFKCTYPKCSLILKSKQSLKRHLMTHFKWTVKKDRKVRKDKGSSRNDMAKFLSGVDDMIKKKRNPSISDEDDPLLGQCDLAIEKIHANLKILQQKCTEK